MYDVMANALTHEDMQKYGNLGSQIGDERPISQVRFSPNSEFLATGSWSGTVKIWSVPSCVNTKVLRGKIRVHPVMSNTNQGHCLRTR